MSCTSVLWSKLVPISKTFILANTKVFTLLYFFLFLKKMWKSITRKLSVLIQGFAFSPLSSQKNSHQSERMSTVRFNCLQHLVIARLLDCFKQILSLGLSSLLIHLFITRNNWDQLLSQTSLLSISTSTLITQMRHYSDTSHYILLPNKMENNMAFLGFSFPKLYKID